MRCAVAGSSAARLCSGIGKRGLGAAGGEGGGSFAFTLDRGGLRRAHLRGRANVQKRYCVHVAGYNLGLVMRQLIGAGTLKRLATRGAGFLWLFDPDIGRLVILILPLEARPEPTSSTRC